MTIEANAAARKDARAFTPARRKDAVLSLLRIRRVEEAIGERYADAEMRCPVHLSIGQEAVAVGVCATLEPRDRVFGAHRGHAMYLAKGGNLDAFIAELHGKATGCSSGRGGSMHMIDLDAGIAGTLPIVGATIPVAVGAAFASARLNDGRVSVVFFGDAATEEGVVAEALDFAALASLPIVFVCENNLYSIFTPLAARQAAGRDLVALARAHGMRAERGDGDDLAATYALATRAVDHARAGLGPVFLELATYRQREHCGPRSDDDLGYRDPEELRRRFAADPVEVEVARAVREGLFSRAELARVEEAIREEIDRAFAAARAAPEPAAVDVEDAVYASPGKERPCAR